MPWTKGAGWGIDNGAAYVRGGGERARRASISGQFGVKRVVLGRVDL